MPWSVDFFGIRSSVGIFALPFRPSAVKQYNSIIIPFFCRDSHNSFLRMPVIHVLPFFKFLVTNLAASFCTLFHLSDLHNEGPKMSYHIQE